MNLQGLLLCTQYIQQRLKRSGLFHRKLGLKRLKSTKMLLGNMTVHEVNSVMTAIGEELEKMHPELYTRIARQTGYGTFSSEQIVIESLTNVSREITQNGEITWSRIISIYSVAGGIAVDCMKRGNSELIPAIQKGMSAVLAEDIGTWIQANGGWSALVTKYKKSPEPKNETITSFIVIVFSLTLLILVLHRLFTIS